MITRGINLYESRTYQFNASQHGKPCVFLSHKSQDKDFVEAIGDVLTRHGINIYLDKNDTKLLNATAIGDCETIVRCIEEGITKSTHILCFISEKTINSWWVPYELGYGKKSQKGLASLIKNDVTSLLPDFLKTEKIIKKDDLKGYIDYLISNSPTLITESVEIRSELNSFSNSSLNKAKSYLK